MSRRGELGQVSQSSSMIITPWVAFTPTGTWSTNTTYTGFWRRVGEDMECRVMVETSGAPTATGLNINIPTGYNIDTAKQVNSGSNNNIGYGHINDQGTELKPCTVLGGSTTSVAPRAVVSDAANAVTETVPMTWANGDQCIIFFSVPIEEFG